MARAKAEKPAKAAKPPKPAKAPKVREPRKLAPEPEAPPQPERDFLVIYEEEGDGLPGDDHLVLDIEAPKAPARGELDVQQRLDLELSNTTNRLGTAGFILSCVGAALGIGLILYFLVSYPQDWYRVTGGIDPSGAVKPTVLIAVLTMALLTLGTIMTHYGRRIQARGNLTQVRIVEKSSQTKAHLR